ncbi:MULTISPECIES: Rieske (2Fe-2S) protein [Rhizobium/Agrobacterium group]|uniref:Oxidoreductase protein n=2 Tax=Rhizobium/Agrobacterium group TaxID=227290 RepID=B9K101_ALLAM|nr:MULTISPECIES: Rieske (2Fe-2S) protein [Rhizobium/Agrobacterium group]ACM38549.1 oxidoreductase protein [Allorhizobium ampelinum S4]MUO26752.1 Rieske 2Fe-2S domain-containing protein [Agrobacterium vitis]MUO41865.1 Rieske 2Fe-2S domain-containing protein [Agrobacterium vitis]MUP10365.1 Rieske 2Fe-2S domain-containing protein [Agrobacterium vitis]
MSIETAWVPVALSSSIEPGTSAGAVVDGAEIVVWRDAKGAAHVWEDRCPHRGMRMSFGFVRGDHIACLYHGWSYDTAGQCTHIPAHPDLDVPKTIRVTTYAAEERDGVIWAALADHADVASIPDLGVGLNVRSLYADCTIQQAMNVLKEAQLPTKEGILPAHFEVLTANAWRLEAGDLRVAIAVQVISAGRLALHLVTDAGSTALRPALARWAEALRLTLEAPSPLAQVA